MKCFYHPEADAALECRICGHPLCGQCPVEVKGHSYCRDCAQARLEGPAQPSAAAADYKSARAAGWLSILPGLGLVYLGEYLKALVVLLLFVGAIHIADHTDLGGILVPFGWVAQIIYTVQEARRLNRLRAGGSPVEEPRADDGTSPIWGWVLIGTGTLFLLDQFDLIRFGEIFEKFWPVLIIALGVQILLRGRRSGEPVSHP